VKKNSGLLRLKAVDKEDLKVISVALQDAIVPVLDLAYDQNNKQFMFAANRFRWETANKNSEFAGERVHSGITFHHVLGVKRKCLERHKPGLFLNLLAVDLEINSNRGFIVEITFSRGAAIRLETSQLLCHLEDFGEPWSANKRPGHSFD
jgi:hypothetical protein|tara:strand:- start:4000 stop:4449 length:450 start_codon:yes stop_codon:yes gene_type:complete